MTAWLCPAHVDDAPCCLRPLPCDEHNIPDWFVGSVLWGNSYLLTGDAEPWVLEYRKASQ